MSAEAICQPSYTTPKPPRSTVMAENIPDELKNWDHWVCWKYESKGDKWTKPPYQINGGYASSTDPNTWTDFNTVLEAYHNDNTIDGIGIVLTDDMGIVGIDLDHMTEVEAEEYLVMMTGTYAEISPSGSGFRIFAKGELPVSGKKKGDVEIYKTGRYLTLTGNTINNYQIIEHQNGIDQLYDIVNDDKSLITKTTTERRGKEEKVFTAIDYPVRNNINDELVKLCSNDPSFVQRFYTPAEKGNRSDHEFGLVCTLLESGFNPSEVKLLMDLSPQTRWTNESDNYKNTTIGNAIRKLETKDSDRPVINISKVRGLDDQIELALEAMALYNDPPKIFKMDGDLCKVTESTPGYYGIYKMGIPDVMHVLSIASGWKKDCHIPKRERKYGMEFKTVDTYPPKPVIEAITHFQEWRGIPWLKGIVSTPIVTPDGEIITKPGFDEKTGFYYAPPPKFQLPEIPDNPTKADAIAAMEWLDSELFSDFLFVDESSKTNMISALITAVGRSMITGCAPLFLINKPTPGTGATLLVNMVALITTGTNANLTKDPGTEEEWRKTVYSMLRDGKTLLCFDNVDGDLSSPSLSQMLTASNLESRILGKSDMKSVPNMATWIANGNGVLVADDMTRRVCYIGLDAKLAEPWTRTGFRHPNIEKWTLEHRGEILAKIYIIIRAWFNAGQPQREEGDVTALGSFEEWFRIIGGMVEFAGRTKFMDNALWQSELSKMSDEWASFIQAFHTKFGERPQKVSDIFGWIISDKNVKNILPKEIVDAISNKGEIAAIPAIGRILKKKNQVRYKNGLMWEMSKEAHSKVNVYAAKKPKVSTPG